VSTTQQSPQLRPLSVGEVLDASFKIVRQSFGVLAGCVLVVALPLNILDTLITASTVDHAFNVDSTAGSNLDTGTVWAGVIVRFALSVVLSALAAAACFRAVSGLYLGERPTIGESLSFAASRLMPVIALAFLYFLGLIPAFLLLIIPGIWLSIAWTVSFPALLSEGLSPTAALGRSFQLVRGRWWPTFGAVLLMNILVGIISAVIAGILTATLVASTASEPTAAVINTIANTLSAVVTLPISAAVLTVLYFDLRVRKEGYDLQLLARGVGKDPSAYDTSPESVGASSGLGGGGFAPPAPPAPAQGGGFAPPRAPAAPGSTPPPSGGLQSGDPLAGPDPPERREGDGGAAS
jgi:uncharacterized membrane protein YeaQ/YmgE (transglycosylase-associated protein family)